VYFIPDVLTSEMMWIGVTTFIMVLLCVWFYHAPLEAHADPQVTPLGTTAPWYFLWIQGALKLGDKVLWGIIFPTIVFVGLMILPYLDTTPSRRYADRRLIIAFCFFLIGGTTVMSWMGLPEYGVDNTAESEINFILTHEPAHSHMGKLLPIPYDQLAPGLYTTEQFDAADGEIAEVLASLEERVATTSWVVPLEDGSTNTITIESMITSTMSSAHNAISDVNFREVPASSPELAKVMAEFDSMMEDDADELLNGFGAVLITDDQENLRRLDVLIIWQTIEKEAGAPVLDENGDPIPVLDENGDPIWRIHDYHIFIHRDAAYFMN